MELEQVEGIGLQVPKAALDKRLQVAPVVALCDMWVKPLAGFGGDIDVFRASFERSGDQTLAASVAVHIRRVDEVDSCVERGPQSLQGIGFTHRPPIGADRPGPEAYLRNLPSCTTQ